jgi:omega-amidase
MSFFTLSLAQMSIREGDPEANLATAREMAVMAVERGSDLLLLPELWGSGYDLSRSDRHATPLDEGLFAEMAAMAREHGMWVGGSLLGYPESAIAGQQRPWNLFALYDPDGKRAAHYGKLHLFRLMHEEQWLAAGSSPTLVAGPWGEAGLAVCYDLRFPELFRHYALAGARLILLPSEWPHPRLEHWRTLLRARAIENQCFVAASNRAGADDRGTRFLGHSVVLDPWGEAVVEGGEEPDLLTATIDLNQVDTVRAKIPVFEDRRVDLY